MAIPFVTFDLDRPHKLRFGMGASIAFEQASGMKLQEVGEAMDLKMAAWALWAMMQEENPAITFAEVVKLVDDYAPNLAYVSDKIGEAITLAYDVGTVANPRPPAGGPA